VVHTLSLAEALARAGQDVTVWTLARGGDAGFFRPVDPAVRLAPVPFPDSPDETVGQRVARSIELLGAGFRDGTAGPGPESYDVVHAQDCVSANAVLAAVPGLPLVRTVHHLDQFTTPQLVACHEAAIVGPAAHLCVSAAVARELLDGWGLRATVIPNGVDAARFEAAAGPEPEALDRREAWQRRLRRYVLAVGGIEPRKGSLDLLEAMALLRRPLPDVRLVVAGGETLFDYRDYRAAFDARAAALGIEPVVLGPVAHDELPALVAAAFAFAFPSTKEGFGLAAMEALAAGVPVVTRDLPVLREVFGDTVTYADDPDGLAAGLEAAVRRTGRDRLGRADEQRRDAGRRLAAAHSWDTAAQAHLRFYGGLAVLPRTTGGGSRAAPAR
jgi:glycosyltransferase-like protein